MRGYFKNKNIPNKKSRGGSSRYVKGPRSGANRYRHGAGKAGRNLLGNSSAPQDCCMCHLSAKSKLGLRLHNKNMEVKMKNTLKKWSLHHNQDKEQLYKWI